MYDNNKAGQHYRAIFNNSFLLANKTIND